MEKITSRENAKIKYACRLASSGAFRRSEGKFLAEGRKLCPELCRGAALETLFCTEAALEKCPELAGLPGEHYLVEDHVADKLADVGTHQGVFGIFRTPVHTLDEAKTGGRYLALERVQDPQDPAGLHGGRRAGAGDGGGGNACRHCRPAGKEHHLPCGGTLPEPAPERGPARLPGRCLRSHRQ